ATEDHSLEKALLQLEEEQQRCENLADVNTLLREHLDKAREVNSALKEDVGKLTADWMRAREELELKESEWRSERELSDNYLRGERNRLLSLWRQVVTFRRHFLEMKTATDRDLSELKAEQMRLSGSILVNCSRLHSGVQLWEPVSLGRPVLKGQAQQQAEQETSQKTWEVMHLQVKGDLEKKELQDRVTELSALLVQSQKQNEEKEKTVKTLNDTVEILVCFTFIWEMAQWLFSSFSTKGCGFLKRKSGEDADCVGASGTCEIHLPCSLLLFVLFPAHSLQALKEELSARQDSISFLLHQHRQQEEKCRKLQQSLDDWNGIRDSSGLFILLTEPCLCSDCANLEKTRAELQQQLEETEQDASHLRQSNTELQLREDAAQGERVEQQQRMERACRDQELLLKDLAALEEKHSLLQSELVVAREKLEESHLQRDLLKQEKHELTMALEKAEQSVAELRGAQNKLSAEVADLHIAAAKMSGINEALALDKVQLNKLVLQLEQENEVLSGKVDELERVRISDQEKLNSCERTNEELNAEKAHLEQLLKKVEEQQEGLQVELRILAEEKAETQEQLSQVYRQQESARSGLEQLRQESSRQGHALATVSKEKELLVHEKAALEVRLAALQRDREGLSEHKHLLGLRSVKETLESSLFEAQQHLSQLEITRSQLEIQLHTVTQAKEVIQGEVKCLQCELEAERSLMRQERENMAQQLLQTEQQYNNTLKLQQTDHEVEINQLLQDLVGNNMLLNSSSKLCGLALEVLQEKELEKNALLETLLQTQGELREANQQLEQLRLEVKEQRENGQVSLTSRLVLLSLNPWPRAFCFQCGFWLEVISPSPLPLVLLWCLSSSAVPERCASVLQVQSLQEAALQKEAALAAREEQLLRDLEESQAGERCSRNSLRMLEAEVSELRLRLCSTESRAQALATECQQANSAHHEARSQLDKLYLVLQRTVCDSRDLAGIGEQVWGDCPLPPWLFLPVCLYLSPASSGSNDARKKIQDSELELSKRQAEKEYFSAHNQELQKQLAQSQEGTTSLFQPTDPILMKTKLLNLFLSVSQQERDRLQAVEEKLVQEIKLLQESVTASETRANTVTDMHHCLEQEFQSTLSLLKIKNEEVEVQWEKIQMLQEEAAQGKALQETLTCMTAILSEREGEVKLCQEERRMLEKQKEMHKTALDQVIEDITEKKMKITSQEEQIQELEKQQEKQRIAVSKMSKELEERDQEIRSQQEQIRELEKQGEMQRTVVSKMSKELEERDQEIRSQQEQIQELEKQREMQSTAVSKMSKELEERDQEIKFQEGKIMILEQHGASQVRNLLVDLDHMKENLKEKNIELMSLTQQIQELEKEREEVKSLHTSLEHLRAALKDRGSECHSQRDQLRLLQQYKEQQEGHLQELHGRVEKMTLSLSQKDRELESQQKQIQEGEEVMEMQLRTVRDQLEQALETLREKDRLIDIQKQQTQNYEEKTEERVNVLHRDLECTKAILKEKDVMVESQKELIETLQKHERDSEQQKEILQRLQVTLKEQEQEILSLRKQCEACKEKEKKHKAEQNNFQATKQTLKEGEKKIEALEEAVSRLQQQKEEAAMQTKAILQKLEYAESSLEARDQEIESLQEHIQGLREQRELEGKQAKSLEQDLDQMSQRVKEKHVEFLRQTEQMNVFQLREESMKVALTSCQKQVNLLEEVVRKRGEENETLRQKLQRQEEELKTLQNLQLRLTEKNDELRHPREQENLLEEALPERERETKAHSDQKESEEEIRALREDLQHVQQTLTKKEEEIKCQRDRVRYLEKTLMGREQELGRQSKLLKQLTSALRWEDEGETLKKQIQKLQKWEEEEAEKRKILQERDHLLQRQKELTQQLEDESKAKGEELERVMAILKQSESREMEWKEKAQALTLALTKSETAGGTLREEIAILQSMVSERDTDRFHHQVGSGIDHPSTKISMKDSKDVSHKDMGIFP
uniref:Rootletin-like coiled-coil domain-containing protein n=1 Tax=Strix occidentalis caurina TaxID=311401 RepID=A0A8D0FIH9_STROC